MKVNVKGITALLLVLAMVLAGCANGDTAGTKANDVPASDDGQSASLPETEGEDQKSGDAADDGARYGGTVVVGYANEPDTMNTYSTHLLGEPITCIVEGLLTVNQNMEFQPVLAKEVPTLENGLMKMTDDGKMTVTYNLKENVKWHDGEPFTSADVKFTWEALADESFLAESKEGVYDVESIETPDDYTVVVYYKHPSPDFANNLFTNGIYPKHICEGMDMNEQTGYNRAPIGTGPFMFKEWVPGEYLEIVRNPNYHIEGQPYLDNIVFKIINDQNTQISQLKTGEVDYVANIPVDRVAEIEAIDGVKTLKQQQNSWRYLDFNNERPGLDDKAVRQAFAYAIDKDAIVNQLFGGIPVVWSSPWQPMDPYRNPDITPYPYDLDKAAALLDEAGWIVGADGIREKDGVRLSYEIGAVAGRVEYEKIQQVIIASVKPLGIELTANNAAATTMNARWNDGDFDMKVGGWITGVSPSRTMFYGKDSIPPAAGINHARWKNDEFTDLMAQADKELNTDKRKELIFKCSEIFNEEVPELILFNSTEVTAIDSKLEGIVTNPTNKSNFWQTSTWYYAE